MSKNIKTLVCCILALVFVAGTVVAAFADGANFGTALVEMSTGEEVSSELDSEVASEVASEAASEAESESESESEVVTYLMGDVNLDGVVTAADARLTLRASAQLEVLSALQTKLANVKADDNRITAADARAILRVSAALDPAFGRVTF